MTARELLEQVRYLDAEVAQLRELRASVYDDLTRSTARLTRDGVRGGGDPHRMDAAAGLAGDVDAKLRELAEVKRAALAVVNSLDDGRQRAVLLAYYVNCRAQNGSRKTWEMVAVDLHLSWRSLQRTRAAALVAVEKLAPVWRLNGT